MVALRSWASAALTCGSAFAIGRPREWIPDHSRTRTPTETSPQPTGGGKAGRGGGREGGKGRRGGAVPPRHLRRASDEAAARMLGISTGQVLSEGATPPGTPVGNVRLEKDGPPADRSGKR